MIDILGWFKQVFCSDCIIEKNLLANTLKGLKEMHSDTLTLLADKTKEVVNLSNELELLRQELSSSNKHSSIQTYKDWMTANIKPKIQYYNYGKGKKRPHTIFADSLKDEGIIKFFIEEDLDFPDFTPQNADDLVFRFNVEFSKKFPTRNYYAADSTLYKVIEYWATAKETIEKLRTQTHAFDCDDVMVLKYSCLYYLLQEYFPNDKWRLRGFIVDLWSGGGHALLGWVKEGPNDWIPIETTFKDDKNSFIWRKDYTIRNQLFYQIRYSFDNKEEYVQI